MGIVHVPRRFADLFPPMGPRTLRRVPEGFVVQPYERFVIRPLGPTLGAEIDGVDLSKPLTEDVEADLQRAFLEWKLLFFRAPAIDVNQFYHSPDISERASTTASWANYRNSHGMVRCHMWERRLAGRNRIYWHADAPFGAEPPRATVLRVLPPAVGGDTLFADMAAAYDNLPDEVKTRIQGLTAIHDIDRFARNFHPAYTSETSMWPPVEHPVVIAHPETGRKTLYVNTQWTRELVGLEPEDGEPLLMYLCAQAAVPEYQCRLNWQPSGLAIWDGYALQHYAVSDYTEGRSFWRIAISGGIPMTPAF